MIYSIELICKTLIKGRQTYCVTDIYRLILEINKFFLKLLQIILLASLENYKPGLHVIATLQSAEIPLLDNYQGFKSLADTLVDKYVLQKLGEVYHNFEPGGFTGIICLSESHISLHTWPEYNKINLDIYLSNYLRENDGTVTDILEEIRKYFQADILSQQNLRR
jgi:S-adenosylmethionine decarboxylase